MPIKVNVLPTAEELRLMLSYDPETGILIRKTGFMAGQIFGKPYDGYISASLLNSPRKAHRIIWKMVHDEEPEIVDHIDGDGTNNRLSNLRSVTNAENKRNSRLHRNNKSGTAGVYKHTQTTQWGAHININGKTKHLGYFDSLEEARAARKGAEVIAGYHPNHGGVRPRNSGLDRRLITP